MLLLEPLLCPLVLLATVAAVGAGAVSDAVYACACAIMLLVVCASEVEWLYSANAAESERRRLLFPLLAAPADDDDADDDDDDDDEACDCDFNC